MPGTSFRFGLDPILGLVPGVGDVAGAALSAAIIAAAVRHGVSRFTLARMAGNVALDASLGVVPVVGDLFDAAWKANRRNLDLLEQHLAAPPDAARADRRFVIAITTGLVTLCIALLIGGTAVTVATLHWLISRV